MPVESSVGDRPLKALLAFLCPSFPRQLCASGGKPSQMCLVNVHDLSPCGGVTGSSFQLPGNPALANASEKKKKKKFRP